MSKTIFKETNRIERLLPCLWLLADDEKDFEGIKTYEDFMLSYCNIRVVKEISETSPFRYRVDDNVAYKFAKPCRILADGTLDFIEI